MEIPESSSPRAIPSLPRGPATLFLDRPPTTHRDQIGDGSRSNHSRLSRYRMLHASARPRVHAETRRNHLAPSRNATRATASLPHTGYLRPDLQRLVRNLLPPLPATRMRVHALGASPQVHMPPNMCTMSSIVHYVVPSKKVIWQQGPGQNLQARALRHHRQPGQHGRPNPGHRGTCAGGRAPAP